MSCWQLLERRWKLGEERQVLLALKLRQDEPCHVLQSVEHGVPPEWRCQRLRAAEGSVSHVGLLPFQQPWPPVYGRLIAAAHLAALTALRRKAAIHADQGDQEVGIRFGIASGTDTIK